MLTNINWACYL